MKIIKTDNTYSIFSGNSVEVFDLLPVGTYLVEFSSFQGFYLEKVANLVPGEAKIYGDSRRKVELVFSGFAQMNRGLGVLLSGEKGHGKTLLLRSLAEQAQTLGIPVILVSKSFNGLPEFLNSIRQEVMIAFDEFEKIFSSVQNDDDNGPSPQTTLLSLFDGIASSKKLLVATVNNMFHLSEFFRNRPGRFHYHFRFASPSTREIQEYLGDKLTQRQDEIPMIVEFLNSITSSYDILRAVVFEMNRRQDSLPVIMEDLNVMATEAPDFKITCHFRDTKTKVTFTRETQHNISLWKNNKISINFDFQGFNNYQERWIHLEIDLSKRISNDDGSFEIGGGFVRVLGSETPIIVDRMVFRKFEESWTFFRDAL